MPAPTPAAIRISTIASSSGTRLRGGRGYICGEADGVSVVVMRCASQYFLPAKTLPVQKLPASLTRMQERSDCAPAAVGSHVSWEVTLRRLAYWATRS